MNWRPSARRAVPSLAAILILAAGCSEPGPTAARLEPGTLTASAGEVGGMARVLQASYRAGTYSAVITRNGGTLDFGIGSISFPAGAVSRTTRISATVDGRSLAVNFEPHGTVFAAGHEPTLTFGVPGVGQAVEIEYLSDSGAVLERLATGTDTLTGTIFAQIKHFSPYAAGIGS